MKEVFLLLGSNRGNRIEYLNEALQMISLSVGTILKKSAIYQTEPWGFEDETSFLNQVIEVETGMQPEELLGHLLKIEIKLGRIRPFSGCGCGSEPLQPAGISVNNKTEHAYTSRTIDLDILFFGTKLVFTDNLMIPHPRLHERRFTLVPLNEIAPGFIHPVLKKTISKILQDCSDPAEVVTFNSNYRPLE